MHDRALEDLPIVRALALVVTMPADVMLTVVQIGPFVVAAS